MLHKDNDKHCQACFCKSELLFENRDGVVDVKHMKDGEMN